jgi:hypothetical protein
MSPDLSAKVMQYIHTAQFGLLSSAAGVIALALIVLLLVGSILLDAAGEKKLARLRQRVDLALIPLVFILGISGAVRLAAILHII